MAKSRIDKVLVAVDGSAESLEAAKYAAELVRALNPKVAVMHVVPNPDIPVSASPVGTSTLGPDDEVAIERALWDGAQAILDRNMEPFRQAGVQVEGVMASGDPAREIVDFARKGRYDLLVVGSRGEGAVERALLGSTSDAVVRESPCPVLVVRRGARAR
ncbi:MAG: universal stress protein [Sphingomonadaceae bacterium]